MGEFILILVLSVGGYTSTTSQAILFPTQAACENAKTAAMAAFSDMRRSSAVCVPRGTP
jgi:hypothetical protein